VYASQHSTEVISRTFKDQSDFLEVSMAMKFQGKL